MGIIVAAVTKNQLQHFQAIQEMLLAALDGIAPGVVIHVLKP
jgi:hypothetical protein